MQRWNKNTLQPGQRQEPSRPNAFETPALSNNDSNDSSSAGVDPFLLDFGTSINVTEDLRREIRTEIQEIDAKIAKGTQAHQQEQRAQKQLQQDLHHTFSEMRNLGRGAADRLEDAQVHSSFLNGLDTTLHTDLARSTGVMHESRKSPVSVLDTSTIMPLKDSHPTDDSKEHAKSGSYKTNQEVLREKEEMVKQLVESIQEQTRLGEERRAQSQKWIVEKQETLERIQSEGLESVLEQTQQKNQHAQVDVQNESQRHDQLTTKVQSVRSQCGKHAQQLADKTKDIKALRAENEAKLVEMNSNVVNASDLLFKEKDTLGTTKSSHALLQSRIKELQKEEALYVEFCQARTSHEEALVKVEEETKELHRLLETLTTEQEKADQELEESKKALGNAQKLCEEAMQKKTKNDQLEETVLKPGEEERIRLAQEKEQLAKQIGRHHAELLQAQSNQKESFANMMEAKNQVSQQVAKLETELQQKQEEAQVRATTREAAIGSLEDELRDAIEKEQKTRSDHLTKMKALQSTHQDCQLASKHSLEAAKESMELEVTKAIRYLEIIQIGSKIIEKAKEKEGNINGDLVV